MSPLALSGGRPKNALTSALVLPSNADLICEVLILSAGAAIAVICESIKKVVMNRRATFINVFIFRIEKVFAKARQEKKAIFRELVKRKSPAYEWVRSWRLVAVRAVGNPPVSKQPLSLPVALFS